MSQTASEKLRGACGIGQRRQGSRHVQQVYLVILSLAGRCPKPTRHTFPEHLLCAER